MEVTIFPRPEIAELLKSFVEVRLHTDLKTKEGESRAKEYQAYKGRLAGSQANPIYAIVDPAEPEKLIAKFEGADLTGRRFKQFLEENAK